MKDGTSDLPLLPIDPMRFEPFGALIDGTSQPGTRRFFSDHLHERPQKSAPVLHSNCVSPSTLPITCDTIERHPHAAQCFMPLDVSRYVVLVAPSDAKGDPIPQDAMAFVVPGSLGVIFHPMVWHMGATVLDRQASFAVLMWRGGALPDDEFRTIPPLRLVE